MSKLVTNNLKLFNVEQFLESFAEPDYNIYYYFVGGSTPFNDDNNPPTLYDNVKTTLVDPYENMIYGQRIHANDVSIMAKRHDWVSNTVYTKYSHDNSDLFESSFYVYVDEGSSYSVFKCIDNNGGIVSTYAPDSTETSASDDSYSTADGYQWKYMYSVSSTEHQKFSTADYIPVVVNSNVVSNAISGSIDNIEVVTPGENFIAYTNGAFESVRVSGNTLVYTLDHTSSSANSNFYKDSAIKITAGPGAGQQRKITGYTVSGTTRNVTIDSAFDVNPTVASTYEISPYVTVVGDGSNAVARAIVNSVSNTIYKIEVVGRGSGYTYANATVTGNTGASNNNTATLKVIISPKNGHGSNAAAELGAHYIGISSVFDSATSGDKVVDENDFRFVGILKDPLIASSTIDISNLSGVFDIGEQVEQVQTSYTAQGVVTQSNSSVLTLANVSGFFAEGNSTVNLLVGKTSNATAVSDSVSQITTYFDQTIRVTGSYQSDVLFSEDEVAYQNSASNGYVYSANATTLRIVNNKGTLQASNTEITQFVYGLSSGAKFSANTITNPDLVKNSGEVIYIENFIPINKTAGQTETLKLILEF
jgi:hypothetical protein